jgi:hypothetical protein
MELRCISQTKKGTCERRRLREGASEGGGEKRQVRVRVRERNRKRRSRALFLLMLVK